MFDPLQPESQEDWYTRYFETDDYEHFNLEVLGPQISSEQVSRVMHWLELRPPQTVLDLCSGAGRHTLELARRGFRAIGVERSPYQMAKAAGRRRTSVLPEALRPVFLRADARHVPLADGSVDAVVCLFNSFGYFTDEGNLAVMQEIQRVLRPGGRLLMDVLNRDSFLIHQPERTWDQVNGGLVLQDLEFLPWSSQLRTVWTYIRPDQRIETMTTLNRLYSAHELMALCSACGLRVTDLSDGEVHGYFNYRNSHSVAVVARKEAP